MAAYGYLCLRGLPFSQPNAILPSKALANAIEPKVITRGGLVFDLNAAAFASGVLIGSPLRQARQVCPGLVNGPFVEAVYAAGLQSFAAALRRETHRFEFDAPHSLFIDFAGSGQPLKVLQALVSASAGFAIFAGLGRSKFTARAAAMAAMAQSTYTKHPMMLPKPQPASELRLHPAAALYLYDLLASDPDGERAFIAGLPVGYLWPIAEEKRERLYRLGLKSCGDVAALDTRELARVFGPDAERISAIARGIDQQTVSPSYTPDEVIRRFDFDFPVASKLTLKRSLGLIGRDLGHAVSDDGLGCRVVELKLHLEDGDSFRAQRSFSRPRGEPEAIAIAVTGLLDRTIPDAPVVGVEVAARGLEAGLRQQMSFLTKAVGQSQQDTLLQTLASLERKFPGGAVRLGPPPVPRREMMLRLVDPLRQRGEGAFPGGPADRSTD